MKPKHNPFVTILLHLIACFEGVYCSLVDTESLYSTLLTGYDKRLLPRFNQSEATEVRLSASIISLNEFEEITGRLAVTVGFHVRWTEERFTWDPRNYSGKQNILMNIKDIWRPHLSIKESINYIQEVGDASGLVRVHSNGTVTWPTGSVIQVFCSVDVTFFPFDSQTCTISCSSFAHSVNELFLSVAEKLSTDFFTANSMWRLKSSTLQGKVYYSTTPVVTISLNLERRSEFFVVFIIVPLLFLGFLNICVFFMPNGSGERHSVAITALLAFVVYMSTINSVIPQSSEPIAYIYYYLLFLIIYSSVIMMLCMCSMRVYENSGSVSDNIQGFIRIIRCHTCRKSLLHRKNKVESVSKSHLSLSKLESLAASKDSGMEDTISKDECQVPESSCCQHFSWEDVGKTFDRLCICALLLVFIIFSTVTVVKLYFNLVFFNV